jgi:hypothetical protein
MVAFNPQPIDAMRARFPAAIADRFDHDNPYVVEAVDLAYRINPIHHFFWADGIHLFITTGKTWLTQDYAIHVVADCIEAMRGPFLAQCHTQEQLRCFFIDRLEELDPDRRWLLCAHWHTSRHGLAHLLFDL